MSRGPKNPAARRGVGPRSGRGSHVSDGISLDQYARGLEAFLAQQPFALIQSRSQMTRPQILWCIRDGEPARRMPSWTSVLSDQLAEKAKAAREAAAMLGARAGSLLMSELDAADQASQQRAELLEVRARINAEAQRELNEGTISAAVAMRRMTPSLGEVQALAALDKLASVGKAAESFRKTFDHPNARLDPITGQARGARTPDVGALSPAAAVAMVEGERENNVVDPLDEYFPEFAGMAPEESRAAIRRMLDTGEMPRRALQPAIIDAEVVEPEDG